MLGAYRRGFGPDPNGSYPPGVTEPPGAPPPTPPSGHISETSPPNPLPFLVALVGFVVIAVLAFVYLRPDDEGELVRTDRLTIVADDTIRAVAPERSTCERISRAQVDLAEEAIFVELVVQRAGEDCRGGVTTLEAEITLPEPVADRDLRPGIGRFEIPCNGSGTSVTCAADR